MSEKKKHALNGPGFYVALCCCVAAIGIAGYFTGREETPKEDNFVLELPKTTENPSTQTSPQPDVTLAPELEATPQSEINPTLSLEEVPEEPPVEAVFDPEEYTLSEDYDIIETGELVEFYDGEVVEAVTVTEEPSFKMPVDGTIAEGFSGDTLIYNKAMGDWRTHNGVDITAAAGDAVCAADGGVIEQAYVDALGNTVVIDHQNGYKTRYSNLESIEEIPVGSKIGRGDALGKVGVFSLGENITEPHLHFEIIYDDSFLDPQAYFE